jgi:uncharacterized protein
MPMKQAKQPLRIAPEVTAETFVIPMEDKRYLIYAPLRQTAFVSNAQVVNFLADCKEGKWTEDTDPNATLEAMLTELEILDGGEEHPPMAVFRGKPEPVEVTLFLTTACNLRCTYCYAQAGDTPSRFMRPEVARRGIEYVARNAARRGMRHFVVNYHGGGEPTVNWPTLTDSFEYAKSLSKDLGLGVVGSSATNGVLKDSQIDWMIANLGGVSVSFDGLPEIQDENRPLVGGKSSSAQAIHTLKRFDEAGFPYGIRVTCTADHIPRLADSVEYICANFGTPRIQVEPAYQMGRWRNAPSSETEGFITAYREAQTRAARYDRSLSFSGARVGSLTNHFCGVTQDSFALSPDGNVSGCFEVFSEEDEHADVFFYAKPSDEGGYNFDKKRLSHLRSQAVQNREFCSGCFAKWTCAGDCYHKSLTVNGTTEFAGSDRCHIIRELTKDQILERIAQSGGLTWRGGQSGVACHSSGKEMYV